eukprot:6297922-Prymnesium_polylepis.1
MAVAIDDLVLGIMADKEAGRAPKRKAALAGKKKLAKLAAKPKKPKVEDWMFPAADEEQHEQEDEVPGQEEEKARGADSNATAVDDDEEEDDDDVHGDALPHDLAALKVADLKQLCRVRGLKVGGVKAEIIARLEATEAAP